MTYDGPNFGSPPQPPASPPPPQGGYGQFPPSGPPPGSLPRESYTPWIKRVGAAIVDNIPIAIVIGIGQGVAFALGDTQCVTDSSGNGYSALCTSSLSGVGILVIVVAGLLALVYWIWNWGYRQGATGSTVGKALLNFQVVSETTWQPIGFGRSIVRQIAHIVDAIICYIGYLFPLWDAKRQTIADKIMGTVCVPR